MKTNISVLHFDPTQPQGLVISLKCEQHSYELTELTYYRYMYYVYTNLRHCTLYVSRTDLKAITLTDNLMTRCPWQTLQVGVLSTRLCVDGTALMFGIFTDDPCGKTFPMF